MTKINTLNRFSLTHCVRSARLILANIFLGGTAGIIKPGSSLFKAALSHSK